MFRNPSVNSFCYLVFNSMYIYDHVVRVHQGFCGRSCRVLLMFDYIERQLRFTEQLLIHPCTACFIR
jgi:hypothetical protein